MIRTAIAAALVAGLTAAALAQTTGTTYLILEASADHGASWSGSLALGGGTDFDALVRVRAVLRNQGTGPVTGLGGATYQPTLSGWNPATDTRLPFDAPADPPVPPPSSFRGRFFPFTSVGMTTASASGLLTSFVDGGGTLRFAGANGITPTTNLAWGVNSAQLTEQLAGANFNRSLDVVLFQYGVHLVAGPGTRTLTATVPLSSIQNAGRVTWFVPNTDVYFSNATADSIIPATITIRSIPSPATLAVSSVCLAVPTLRRRKRTAALARGARP